jgi:23S rRNA (cytidine1920-2'-O)/16S rRNA (cytidine1409-2'-O)-methyltransferase
MSENQWPQCVSRGGIKLHAALDAFGVDVAGLVCADLGCNVGGFTDCLLQRGAEHVYAVDTGYGTFAWKLRNDDRVTVFERTNALHFDPREAIDGFAGCDLAVIDLGWTRQEHAIPAALRWLKANDAGRIIALIKPHYEAGRGGRGKHVLGDDEAKHVMDRTLAAMPSFGVDVMASVQSPIRGGKAGKGNVEYLAMVKPA